MLLLYAVSLVKKGSCILVCPPSPNTTYSIIENRASGKKSDDNEVELYIDPGEPLPANNQLSCQRWGISWLVTIYKVKRLKRLKQIGEAQTNGSAQDHTPCSKFVTQNLICKPSIQTLLPRMSAFSRRYIAQ